MTAPQRAVVARLSADVAVVSQYLARMSADLATLDRLLTPAPVPAAAPAPTPPPIPSAPTPARDEGWIGKVLAVAGVAVTLVGVVLLLVLAAQAGILRPEVRVAAGGALAVGLVSAAGWLYGRVDGRVGAIALAATGVAAAYIDVVAVTTIYHWAPAPVGLIVAAVIGGGGLTLARRWDSEHLGVLVFVPLLVLAPVVTGGITLVLVGFLLALSAAALPVQLGRDWIYLHCARTAAYTIPLLLGLVGVFFDGRHDPWLAGACGIGALLSITGGLILLRHSTHGVLMALATSAGVSPVLCVTPAVDDSVAALMAAALSAALLAVVLCGGSLLDTAVRQIWSALAAVAAAVAVLVAFDGDVAAVVLLVIAIVVGAAGRRDVTARAVGRGVACLGGALYLVYAWPGVIMTPTEMGGSDAASVLIGSLLVIACAAVFVWNSRRTRMALACAAVATVYAIAAFTVTAGVLVGGPDGGFFAGHMVATVGWIALAAALFGHAARLPRAARSLPIGGGLTLVAAAMAKLFLFDLGTLDGVFRVAVFIVVGLALLAMGAGYARLLARHDEQDFSAQCS
jgi:hypothetical protein